MTHRLREHASILPPVQPSLLQASDNLCMSSTCWHACTHAQIAVSCGPLQLHQSLTIHCAGLGLEQAGHDCCALYAQWPADRGHKVRALRSAQLLVPCAHHSITAPASGAMLAVTCTSTGCAWQTTDVPTASTWRCGMQEESTAATFSCNGCRRNATSSPALTPQQVPRGSKRRKLGTPSGSSSPGLANGLHVDLTSSEAEGDCVRLCTVHPCAPWYLHAGKWLPYLPSGSGA